jgi:hypothetical protein
VVNALTFAAASSRSNIIMTVEKNLEGGSEASISLHQTACNNSEEPNRRLELYRTASLLPPPDGGLTAWLQVLSGFIVFFNTW